jgi:rhamnose transport system ATP-binding protein
MPPVLELHEVSKAFGGTIALNRFSLALEVGEIHALVGENGAGKSTLIKTMTGIHQPDSGTVRIGGQPVVLRGTGAAQDSGIAAIYQEPMVFPDLTVAENIFISHRARGAVIDWAAMQRDAAQVIARLGVTLDPRRPAADLTLAEQQTVEIARAISLNVRVLIMDEPSASLSDHEVSRLHGIARSLRDQGVAILYISHRLEEVMTLAETVTVMRDGQHISTRPIAEVTQAGMIAEMVGRDMQGRFARVPGHARADTVLTVQGLTRPGAFRDVSFDLRKGEILCFAGLVGARRTDVGLALFGIAPATAGQISIDGQPVTITSPRAAMAAGIAYVSEDRRKLGLALSESITANVTLPKLDSYAGPLGLINRAREMADAQRFGQRMRLKAASLMSVVGTLSGGNQQKVMLAKWLNTDPRLLIVDEPTRGIDIGAKAEVHQLLRELAAEGVAIMVISSDLPEVMSLADRIVVMREGRVVDILDGASATDRDVMALAVSERAA